MDETPLGGGRVLFCVPLLAYAVTLVAVTHGQVGFVWALPALAIWPPTMLLTMYGPPPWLTAWWRKVRSG